MEFNGIYLSPGEITYIIELLAGFKDYEEVCALFFEFTEGEKRLPKKAIQQIQLKFSDKIKRQNELYLTYIEGNPLAHLKVRLDIAYKILKDSLKLKPAFTIKVGDGEYETVMKADNVTALRALQLAMNDLNKREELDIEQKKNAPLDQTNSSWDVNDGLSSVG